MTISESLLSLNAFPIPSLFIEKVGIDRGLDTTLDYDISTSISQAYELATADVFVWLSAQPTLKEQEVSIAQDGDIKKNLLSRANAIYAKYNDSKFSGFNYGFIGEAFNG